MLELGLSAILTILAIVVLIKFTGKILKIVVTLALVGAIVYFVASFISGGGLSFLNGNYEQFLTFASSLRVA